MEPYSANKIKRKKNRNPEFDAVDKDIAISFTSISHEAISNNIYNEDDIYNGEEKIPFKKRDPEHQTILRDEFE